MADQNLMRLLSVNIGQPQSIQDAKASAQTGIYKLPVRVPVEITENGLVGDAICDSKNHGGVDQAVYVYGMSDYAWWAKSLGQRPGLYCRVIQAGYVQCGDVVSLEPYSGETITALDLFRAFYATDPDAATLRRHLAAPIGIRDRIDKEGRLRELLAQKTTL